MRVCPQQVRGDRIGWFDGDEPELALVNLSRYLSAVDRLVGHVGDTLEELLDRQVERSSAMVTCYPGNGSRYIRHIDNPNKNGRLITAIYYMNLGWQPEHGVSEWVTLHLWQRRSSSALFWVLLCLCVRVVDASYMIVCTNATRFAGHPADIRPGYRPIK